MVLSTLALVGIIQLFLLLAGGLFFLLLHIRFLKKQIRKLRGEDSDDQANNPLSRVPTETDTPTSDLLPAQPSETLDTGPENITGEIAELRKMLDEKLLLTANLRKLIEALEQNPDSVGEVTAQQRSSLLHLEEYIKLTRQEAAAVEDNITHYKAQLAKAKKMLIRLKDQYEACLKQVETKKAASPANHETPLKSAVESPETPVDTETSKRNQSSVDTPQKDQQD